MKIIKLIASSYVVLVLATFSTISESSPFPVIPVGTELDLQTDDSGIPDIARDAAGNYVLVWEIYEYPNDREIYAQRFNLAGNPIGGNFRVNSYSPGKQYKPALDVAPSGNFVVLWQSSDQDGSGEGIFGQRYDMNGVALGTEFQANNYTTQNQNAPSVALLPDGGFVVTWSSYLQDGDKFGVYARHFDADGQPVGNEFQVNQYTASSQTSPVIAANSAGDIVITWASYAQGGQWYDIYARLYDSLLQPKGNEYLVNTTTAQFQVFPAVAIDASGIFAIAWSSGSGNWGNDVYARRFDASGLALGTEFSVNSHTTDTQFSVDIAMSGSGDFVISWESWLQDGSGYGIYAKQYDTNGLSFDGELAVNTITPGSQYSSAVMVGTQQDFLVVWTGTYVAGTEARRGIYGQWFGIDVDNDGFAGQLDNCPLIANPTQLDTDTDGDGNLCDADDDNDGLTDALEATLLTNPLLPDSDIDGVDDLAEISLDGDPSNYTPGQDMNPLSADTDGDSINDGVDPLPVTFNYTDGDLAPLGAPDGLINGADLLVSQRIILGDVTAGNLELSHGDLYPVGAPDGVINIQDHILLLPLLLPK